MNKKNILFVMTDQLRWDAVFDDNNPCQMPATLDFAEKAVRFDKAYTLCPLCSPARGSVFTGLWPHQNGLTDNSGPYCPQRTLHIEHKTYLERLQKNGYNITYSGKWHAGDNGLNKRRIEDVRVSDGGSCQASKKYKLEKQQPVGEWFTPYYLTYDKGNDVDRLRTDAGKDQLREVAKKYKEDGTPFCSVISYVGPHFPHNVQKKYSDMYKDLPADFMPDNFCAPFKEENKPYVLSRAHWPSQETGELTQEDWRKTIQHYWGFCTYIDHLFQEIKNLLDEEDLWKDTVVAFVSDHGEMLGAHGRFDKGPDFYEETVHIPFIIRDPEKREPVNKDSFVNLIDLYPTLISLANASEILLEEEKKRNIWQTNHEYTFMTYDAYQGRNFMLRGIRDDRYKYTWRPRDLDELYDMQEDPGERNNLIASEAHQDIIKDLKDKLDRWMIKEGDYLYYAKHIPQPGSYIDGREYDTPNTAGPNCDPKRGRD